MFSNESIPYNKDLLKYAYDDLASLKPTTKVKPISIAIIDHSIAIIFYYWKWESQTVDWSGKGRSMHTFIKQGDKWTSIGAIYSKCSKPPPCPSEW